MNNDASFALQGRLLREIKHDAAASREAFGRIVSSGWRLHPQITVERDLTLSLLGASAVEECRQWLAQTDSLADDGLIERRACLLFDEGDYRGARELLAQTAFEKVHQRYSRTRLWQAIQSTLGDGYPAPASLGEDDLAVYGAYRVQNQNGSEQ